MSSVTENTNHLQNFLKELLPREVRILINGANGWLGKNISESLLEIFGDDFYSKVLLTGSGHSLLSLQSGTNLEVTQWSTDLIQKFEPTHVIQLAFKTRDRVREMPIEHYLSVNEEIIKRAIWMISLPSLQGFMHTSSGAVMSDSASEKSSDPYGYLKRLEEEQYAHTCAENNKQYLGLRVWSTSGRYIKTGGLFAIENLISQALSTRTIHIKSAEEVWRSFADAKEIMLAGLIAVITGRSGVYNSGGRNIEIGGLAKLVANAYQAQETEVTRSFADSYDLNVYTSIEPSIERVLIANKLAYSDLEDQVSNTMDYLVWLNSQTQSIQSE